MITLLGKTVTWIVTSTVGLVFAVSAIVLNRATTAEGSIVDNLKLHWPPHHHHHPPVVPEVNTGLVLLPIIVGILLIASRQLLRGRAAENR